VIPTAEVFGGYAFMHQSANGSSQNYSKGWNAAVNVNVNQWLGVGGQFGGVYTTPSGSTTSLHTMTYLFGPTYNMRSNEKFTPFVHALFGRVSDGASNSGVSASIGAFGYGVGGGINYHLNPQWSIRPVQLDYIRASFSSTSGSTTTTTSVNHIRICAGVVWNFGKTK
jgi:hypothetical protein